LSFLWKQESRNMKKKIHNALVYMKAYADSPGFLLPATRLHGYRLRRNKLRGHRLHRNDILEKRY